MTSTSSSFRGLLGLAAFVIVVTGLEAAAPLLVTLLMAAFIAILCAPPYLGMLRLKIPAPVALLVLIGALLCLQVALISVVANTLGQLSADLPSYQAKMTGLIESGIAQLNGMGVSVSKQAVLRHFDPGLGISFARWTLSGLGSLASSVFLILLAVLFILLEATGFRHKLRVAFGGEAQLAGATEFIAQVKLYMRIKTAISLVTAALVFALLSLVGVDYAVLWALLAFMFNYVPSIGSIFAAVPAVLLTLLQLGGWDALIVAGGYAVINIILGNLIEPRLMGKGVGLSALVAFLSLVLWGSVLGPVGMLLSIPLTVLFKLAMAAREETRWIAILLGPDMADQEFASALGEPK